MTDALSKKGKIVVDAPRSGRQSVDTGAPSMKGKSVVGAPSMKGKRASLPKEGKKAKTTSGSIQFSREKFGD